MLSITGLKSLLQRIQFSDPRLYDLLFAIIGRLEQQSIDIGQIERDLSVTPTITAPTVNPVEQFSYQISPDFIRLTWNQPDNIANFELRKGSVWDTAQRILITNTTSAILDPLSTGTHNYLIKSIDVNGIYSDTAKGLSIIIPPIGAVSITHDVIDNFVLLYWTTPDSAFRISHYIVKRNDSLIGKKDGTFTSVFEQVAGDYTYSIIPVDIAGNTGPEISRQVRVNVPTDFVLLSNIQHPIENALITRTFIFDNKVLFGTYDVTWEQHFALRGWSTIQDQIDAGYPYYIQPSSKTAFYEILGSYTIDYGTILSGAVTITFSYQDVAGSGYDIQVYLTASDDGITWVPWVQSRSTYFSNFRYLKISLQGTARD